MDEHDYCAVCGHLILKLPAPVTRELTWYHSDHRLSMEHDAAPGGEKGQDRR